MKRVREKFRIALQDRGRLEEESLRDLTPSLFIDLTGAAIPTNYGFFFISKLSYDGEKLLEYSRAHLAEERYREIREEWGSRFKPETGDVRPPPEPILADFLVEDRIGKECVNTVVREHPDVWNSGHAHVILFSTDLMEEVDFGADRRILGYVESLNKLIEIFKYLQRWGERVPGEVLWQWGWENKKGEPIQGLAIDIRFFEVFPRETLLALEGRIDDVIEPIKEYLAMEQAKSWRL